MGKGAQPDGFRYISYSLYVDMSNLVPLLDAYGHCNSRRCKVDRIFCLKLFKYVYIKHEFTFNYLQHELTISSYLICSYLNSNS